MSLKADNGNPGKSNLDNEIKRVFVILKHELMFSEKNSFYENMISKIKTLDKFISYKIVFSSVRKLFFVNIGLLFVMLWKLSSFLKQYKPPIPKEEISSMLPVLFLVLVLLCFFPILLLIELMAVNLSGQRNSEDILLNIEKRTDYLLTDESLRIIEETNSTYDEFNFHSISIETFVLDSLRTHFEYLLKQEEKNKDKANAIIPILAAIVIWISYFMVGIPKELINVLGRSSQYESIAILTGFLIIVYVAFNQFSHARFSVKYLKCISTIEKLKSLNNARINATEIS